MQKCADVCAGNIVGAQQSFQSGLSSSFYSLNLLAESLYSLVVREAALLPWSLIQIQFVQLLASCVNQQ